MKPSACRAYAAINGSAILLKWKHSEEKQFLKSLYLPIIVTGAITIVLVIAGLRDVLMAVFAGHLRSLHFS